MAADGYQPCVLFTADCSNRRSSILADRALELCTQRMILLVMDPTRHRQDGLQAYMRSAQDRPVCMSSGSWLELLSVRPTWPRSTNPNLLWGPRQLGSSILRCLCRTTACSTRPRLQSCVPWDLVGMARERPRAMQPTCCRKSVPPCHHIYAFSLDGACSPPTIVPYKPPAARYRSFSLLFSLSSTPSLVHQPL